MMRLFSFDIAIKIVFNIASTIKVVFGCFNLCIFDKLWNIKFINFFIIKLCYFEEDASSYSTNCARLVDYCCWLNSESTWLWWRCDQLFSIWTICVWVDCSRCWHLEWTIYYMFPPCFLIPIDTISTNLSSPPSRRPFY